MEEFRFFTFLLARGIWSLCDILHGSRLWRRNCDVPSSYVCSLQCFLMSFRAVPSGDLHRKPLSSCSGKIQCSPFHVAGLFLSFNATRGFQGYKTRVMLHTFIPVTMPRGCITGKIVQWKKRVGDRVQPGEILAEVKSDYIHYVIAQAEEGILGKIFVKDGEDGTMEQVVAVLVQDKADLKNVDKYVPPPVMDAKTASLKYEERMYEETMLDYSSGRDGGYEACAPPARKKKSS